MSRDRARRSLGRIVGVFADRFTVELNFESDSFTLVGFDDQHYVARLGSFVLIPLQTSYVIGEVIGLREREASIDEQVRSNLVDSHGLNAIKFLDVVPVGTLPLGSNEAFRFGVTNFPPLYADVLYAETDDLDRIFDVSNAVEPIGDEENGPTRTRAFEIGTSVVFDDYKVKVRIDDFFGGHNAILGNTGSGKSCTVASILQSVFDKSDEFKAVGATFIILDTNGEYRQAFDALETPIEARLTFVPGGRAGAESDRIQSTSKSGSEMRLPHWFLSAEEWELLLRASERSQRPILRLALGLTSIFNSGDELESSRSHIMATAIGGVLASSDSVPSKAGRILGMVQSFETETFTLAIVAPMLAISYGAFADDCRALFVLVEQNTIENFQMPEYSNEPFQLSDLIPALELAILHEEAHGNANIRDYCSSLITRAKSIRDRSEFRFMDPPSGDRLEHELNVKSFVLQLLGLEERSSETYAKRCQVSIIDMSHIDDEIVEIVSSVVTRLIFEFLKSTPIRSQIPVNLILEEAHRYVSEEKSEYAVDATKIFERVAKEGRKYGLLLTIASQRPSELSKTVLSQCSNYVVHRIQNPDDLQHIRRMTPFISESIINRLPALPKQHALIFGNAVNLPMIFKVREASPRPQSDDAKISVAWFIPVST
jgi:DNA helicase HerA-like ATPase